MKETSGEIYASVSSSSLSQNNCYSCNFSEVAEASQRGVLLSAPFSLCARVTSEQEHVTDTCSPRREAVQTSLSTFIDLNFSYMVRPRLQWELKRWTTKCVCIFVNNFFPKGTIKYTILHHALLYRPFMLSAILYFSSCFKQANPPKQGNSIKLSKIIGFLCPLALARNLSCHLMLPKDCLKLLWNIKLILRNVFPLGL